VGYKLDGRAFDDQGTEVAGWWSDEYPTFKDGRTISYIWRGETHERGDLSPERLGLARIHLRPGDNHNGKGQVQHVAINLELEVTVERVTKT
jgi:hypothetical protein